MMNVKEERPQMKKRDDNMGMHLLLEGAGMAVPVDGLFTGHRLSVWAGNTKDRVCDSDPLCRW